MDIYPIIIYYSTPISLHNWNKENTTKPIEQRHCVGKMFNFQNYDLIYSDDKLNCLGNVIKINGNEFEQNGQNWCWTVDFAREKKTNFLFPMLLIIMKTRKHICSGSQCNINIIQFVGWRNLMVKAFPFVYCGFRKPKMEN